jgi:hypothetical protein
VPTGNRVKSGKSATTRRIFFTDNSFQASAAQTASGVYPKSPLP